MDGPKGLTIRRVQIGPGAKSLVTAHYTGARFIGLWFMFIWKYYWTSEEKNILLKKNLISYNYRVTNYQTAIVPVWDVFKRLYISQYVFEQELLTRMGVQRTVPQPGKPRTISRRLAPKSFAIDILSSLKGHYDAYGATFMIGR